MKVTNFWEKLKKPFFVLAPMDDVTDTVFRQMIGKIARPDVFFTEFTSADGLNSAGRAKLMPRLLFQEQERPVVAQIWGTKVENFREAAKLIKELGFDGIDINMGCPVSGVIQKGTCSALIKNPELAKAMIQATKEGAGDLPVSVKTRIGFSTIATEEWIGFLLSLDLAALTIHGRTAKEMSKVPAHWDEIGKAVKLRDQMGLDTLIIGNGDVADREEGEKLVKEYGVDGVMIGRGIFKNPRAFAKDPKKSVSLEQNLKYLLMHATLFEKTWGTTKNFLSLRKFFKAYVHGFEGASELRNKLIQTNNLEEVKAVLSSTSL